jgi:hypothetical protein
MGMRWIWASEFDQPNWVRMVGLKAEIAAAERSAEK